MFARCHLDQEEQELAMTLSVEILRVIADIRFFKDGTAERKTHVVKVHTTLITFFNGLICVFSLPRPLIPSRRLGTTAASNCSSRSLHIKLLIGHFRGY